jgi:hypothetical protein
MKEIKGLFDEINFNSIPRTIYNKFKQLDNKGNSTPLIFYFEEHDCYIILDHFDNFERTINKGLIDENNVEIKGNKNIIYNLLNEYGNGFRKGYNDFDNLVKPDNNLFKLENNQIAFKVFSEIDTLLTIAGFTYTFGDNGEMKITKKLMFESGYKWGKKYKAWEIILNNVPLFETLFEKFKPSEIIHELIDNSKDEFKGYNQNQENEIETQIKLFNIEIFEDQKSYGLFLFLVDRYATSKQPKQFSQIFHWMKENNNSIKPNTGVKYRKFVREQFPEMVAKFSRIEVNNRHETPTLNELKKEFNSLSKN